VLNFIYYPVSFILWFWHQAFGYVLGYSSGIAWALAVVFLVFTLRLLLFKPFVHQVRSMRKMQEFAPEMQKLKKKYGNDRQKLAEEMQKLQRQEGFNPLGGCLPVLVQVPVFIGLFHVLREFQPGDQQNYFFDAEGVESFVNSSLFGAKLNAWPAMGSEQLAALGTSMTSMLIVMIPLMIAAGIFTHITARHSVARQTQAQRDANPQAEIMNKLMLYVFPIGVVVGAPFLPLAVLLYWVANNLWTLGQQYIVYRKIDAEEAEKKTRAAEVSQTRAPRPGQKPVRPERSTTSRPEPERPAKISGGKPVARKPASTDGATNAAAGASPNGSGSAKDSANGSASSSESGTANGTTRQPARRGGKKRR
jgi:YidC/Oxa1 family membrane protein insertase